MMIDGKKIASDIRLALKTYIDGLPKKPGLGVILVGDDPGSHIYVRNKEKACSSIGMVGIAKRMPANATFDDVAQTINEFNHDPNIHGVLLQLPLPQHLSDVQEELVQMITPEKDVDGLTTLNAGKLFLGHDNGMVACTPQGALHLIKTVEENIAGKHAVVIGRSNLFGKPMAQLLLQENCTVTTAHSKTENLNNICAQADILISAAGQPKMVKKEWVKDNAIVIDVGINRLPSGKLSGDVDFDAVKNTASAITPVPGGVGPMTIAYLLKNTLKAFQRAEDIS